MIFVNCYLCGKEFLYTGCEYIYRRQNKGKRLLFCGWNCMRKWEKENEGDKKNV